VYRHTETVQVTTRSTYVDEHPPAAESPRGYDGGHGGHGGQDWSPPVPRGRAAEPYEESWTDQKLRERYGRRPRPYDRADDSDDRWNHDSGQWREPVSAEPPSRGGRRRWEDDSSADLRAGQRWAAVRDDDRGRELRMGERHVARHSDDTGSEVRYEDRWAAVRREENGHGGGRPDYGRRALPAAGSEPSWNESWDEPVREARSHRYRPDFELTDERWR
jgi:hypothetical protein